MSSRAQIKENNFSAIYTKIIKAAAASVIISALLLLLFSFMMSKNDVLLIILNPFSSLLISLCCFTSGFIAAKHIKRKGMAVGAACGVIIYIFMMLLAFMYSSSIGILASTYSSSISS